MGGGSARKKQIKIKGAIKKNTQKRAAKRTKTGVRKNKKKKQQIFFNMAEFSTHPFQNLFHEINSHIDHFTNNSII